ncbi:MAG: imidazolonepropionase [Planctomycetes bacterium]|nr:imidazolonepropionase [Planctomycetota bacterium]
MRTPIDLLIHGLGSLVGLHELPNRPRVGAELGHVVELPRAAVAVRGGRVVEVGREEDLERRYAPARRFDGRGAVAIPGFVDAHTHPIFAGTRESEYERRLKGATYVEIAREGGGILSSVRGVRAASEEELAALVRQRLDRFLALGTTAVECKSGYGLSLEDELKSLRALRRASAGHPLHLETTLLGAHEIPPEHRAQRERYVDLVCDEMIPAVAAEHLASYCDVFCEAHVFTVAESRRVLEAGRAHGLRPRLHADQLTALGGAELAAELGAVSADHLDHVSERGIEALRAAGTIPVLLPGVGHFLRLKSDAPARRLIDAGLPVAIATDMNPGSCYSFSMPMMIHLACQRMGLEPAEALVAATLNGAFAAGCGESAGSLHPGKRCDLLLLDVASWRHLAYEFGRSQVTHVFAAGELVFERAEPRPHLPSPA